MMKTMSAIQAIYVHIDLQYSVYTFTSMEKAKDARHPSGLINPRFLTHTGFSRVLRTFADVDSELQTSTRTCTPP